ncbi:hypothetical protein [Bacillus sp. RO1]|uniref:hypothetical protein n=1 Tax=Bacillus sp. RO1 TaxID=2722703 RepID=UPI001456FE3C|nr:hypothetical protein [Bacillus sp. RO1]NLP50411.1 hypothetical protein [Bacillus sp. RO1]
MKKLSRGALSMVLAGAVTFSVTNALLAEYIAGDHALNILGNQVKADVTSEKTEKNQPPTTKGKEEQNKEKPADTAAVPKNPHVAEAATQKETKKTTVEVAKKPAKKDATTSTSDSAGTSTKAPTPPPPVTAKPPVPAKPPEIAKPAEPAKPVQTTKPKTTGNSQNSAATRITNNGQDVSQAAKEKAERRQEDKENKGKGQ